MITATNAARQADRGLRDVEDQALTAPLRI